MRKELRKNKIVPYVLTFNEEDNIASILNDLKDFEEVLVIDSFSTDKTEEIVNQFTNAKFIQNEFISHSAQHKFATALCSSADWCIRLDADWRIPAAALHEIINKIESPEINAISVGFDFAIHGNLTSVGLYGPVTCIFRPDNVDILQDGHTERIVTTGNKVSLGTKFIHDDRKPLSRFFRSQERYSILELKKHSENKKTKNRRLRNRVKSTIRQYPILSLLILISLLSILKLGALKGDAARHYIFQRVMAETFFQLRALDRNLRK